MAYSNSYFVTRESWRDWQIEADELAHLARVAPGMRILEIGCGGGGLLKRLDERGAQAVGVDTLRSALDLAQARVVQTEYRISLLQIGDNGALAFRSNLFDAVIAQHLLEHVADLPGALCEWKRVLKKGGRLAIATPNAHYPDPAHFADVDHAHIYSSSELQAATEQAGLVVESSFTLFPYLSHLRALRAFGVLAHRVFRYAPYWSTRGRTIMLAARKVSE